MGTDKVCVSTPGSAVLRAAMLALVVLVAAVSAEALKPVYDAKSCIKITGQDGQMVDCPDFHVLRGLCTSGMYGDCPGNRHTGIECCSDLRRTEPAPFSCETKSGSYGNDVECVGSKNVMRGACSSGFRADCNNNYTQMKCCDDYSLEVDYDDCTWLVGTYGEWVSCPSDKVGAGMCSSGRRADCGGWHTRLKCCSVKNP